MKQVVGKRINKKQYLYPLPVPLPGGVDGLYTLRSSHKEGILKHNISILNEHFSGLL